MLSVFIQQYIDNTYQIDNRSPSHCCHSQYTVRNYQLRNQNILFDAR